MLLIQADLIKAVWFVMFPIYTYTTGPVASESAFCQVSGFFFAVGIESSDVAVLLIALHSAMYIWRPQSGLYPYRRLAYAAYVLVPLLFASLAFADGGYHNVGYFCYLSNGRGRASLALSWIPRYILFAIIIVTYLCIYVYVRRRIMNYEHRASSPCSTQQSRRTPAFVSTTYAHDRDSSLSSSLGPPAARFKDRLHFLSPHNILHKGWTETIPETEPIHWNLSHFAQASSSVPTTDEQDPHLSSTKPPPDHADPTPPPTCRTSITRAGSSLPSSPSSERWVELAVLSDGTPAQPRAPTTPGTTRPNSSGTVPAWREVLGLIRPPQPCLSSPAETNPPTPALVPHIYHDALASQASRNRDKIRRQLRSLFVYPLLYLVIWTFPMVNHVLGFRDPLPASRPAWVLALSVASLAVQGAADSAVFTAREKPWRYVGQKGFWDSVRAGWWYGGREAEGVGLSREEMSVEARIARARRKQEMLDELGGKRKRGSGRKDWWEFADGDDGYV